MDVSYSPRTYFGSNFSKRANPSSLISIGGIPSPQPSPAKNIIILFKLLARERGLMGAAHREKCSKSRTNFHREERLTNFRGKIPPETPGLDHISANLMARNFPSGVFVFVKPQINFYTPSPNQ
jgi:hypothetical protein